VQHLTALEGRATPRNASAAPTALPAAPTYARPVSERTLLYALVQAHYLDFIARHQTRKTTRSGKQPAEPCSARCRESARHGHGPRDSAARDSETPLAVERPSQCALMDQLEQADFEERQHRKNLHIQRGFCCKLRCLVAAPSTP